MEVTCFPKPVLFSLNELQNKDVNYFLKYSIEAILNFKEHLIFAWLQEEEKWIKGRN